MKRILSLIVFTGIAIGSYAQQVLTLDSCRTLALANNKELRISQEKINAARYQKKAAFTNFLPKIDVMGAYMRTQKEISLLSDEQKQTISNIRQNAAGAVTSATLTIEESGYGETYRASGNFTCTYDSGNRLIKMVSESSSPEYSYEAVYTNTWQDGNLIKTVMTYTEKETEEGETYEYNGYEEYNF